MNENARAAGASSPLTSRKWVYGGAWALYLAGLAIPAPASFYRGGRTAASGFYVAAKAILWSEAYPPGITAAGYGALLLFALALVTNLVFVFTLGLRRSRRIGRSWRVLLIASLAVDASMALLFPEFARLPGYWLWLFGFAAAAWALLRLPVEGPAEPGARRGPLEAVAAPEGIPAVLVVALSLTFFWMLVGVVNFAQYRREARGGAPRAEPKPAKLTAYVTDEASVLDRATFERLTDELAAFEKETSNQVAVAVYPRVPTASLEDFTLRTAEASRLGRKGLDNGAILFVFVAERAARIEVGYGLEGALPDARTFHILEEELAPPLARGAWTEGIEKGVGAILADVRGEYANVKKRSALRQALLQTGGLLSRFFRSLWPFLRRTTVSARIAISFWGTIFGFGIASGVANAWRLAARAARTLLGRPVPPHLADVRFAPILDTLKVAVFVGALAWGCFTIVAGGGAFGGGGSLARW